MLIPHILSGDFPAGVLPLLWACGPSSADSRSLRWAREMMGQWRPEYDAPSMPVMLIQRDPV